MDKQWNDFVEKLRALVQKNPDRNEAETKSKLVEPVLRKMGWDFFGDEVELEYPVSFATSTSKVDYALKQNERPVVFVEVKALKGDISYRNVKQALDYSTHEDVRWCVVTNGNEWRIYDADKFKDEKPEIKPRDARVEQLLLEDFTTREKALEIISRASIESGDTERRVQSIWQTKNTIVNFKAEKENLKEKITTVLREQSGELLYEKLESLAGKFVNDVISELKNFIQEEEQKEPKHGTDKQKERYELDPEQLEYKGQQDLTHTKLDEAIFGRETDISNWKDLINTAIKQGVRNGKEKIILDIIPNSKTGMSKDNPNRYMVEETNISIIPMDANHCALYSYMLAQEINETVKVKFHWRDKEGALYPGEKGLIQFQPPK